LSPVVASAVERRDPSDSGKNSKAVETDAISSYFRQLRIRQHEKETEGGISSKTSTYSRKSTIDDGGEQTMSSTRPSAINGSDVTTSGSTSAGTSPASETGSSQTVFSPSSSFNGQLPTDMRLTEIRSQVRTTGKINGSKNRKVEIFSAEQRILFDQAHVPDVDDVRSIGSKTSETQEAAVGNTPVKRSTSKLPSSGLGRRLNFFVRDRVIFFTQKDSKPATEAATYGASDTKLRQRSSKSKSSNGSR
jgi:hypothetical protein